MTIKTPLIAAAAVILALQVATPASAAKLFVVPHQHGQVPTQHRAYDVRPNLPGIGVQRAIDHAAAVRAAKQQVEKAQQQDETGQTTSSQTTTPAE